MENFVGPSCENQEVFCDTVFTNENSNTENEFLSNSEYVMWPFVVNLSKNEGFQWTNDYLILCHLILTGISMVYEWTMWKKIRQYNEKNKISTGESQFG